MLDKFKNFGRKTNSLLGVDISSTSVKIVKLSSSGGKYKLDSKTIWVHHDHEPGTWSAPLELATR